MYIYSLDSDSICHHAVYDKTHMISHNVIISTSHMMTQYGIYISCVVT